MSSVVFVFVSLVIGLLEGFMETNPDAELSDDGKRLKTDTNSTEACEIYEDKVSIYSNGVILLVILLGSLFGMFLFRQKR